MALGLKNKLAEWAQPAHTQEQLKFVVVGHVDHGKSTLIGRLLHDVDAFPDGKEEAIRKSCAARGMPFEWSFLLDALQAERDQGITIDTTQIWFKTKKRGYVIIDAPGHKEFLKNMISGAASAEAAVLVIDAKEGVKEQSRRHGYLLHLLGIKQIIVAVNKMDMLGYDAAQFHALENECREYLGTIGITPAHIIPLSAREGEGIAKKTASMTWYQGPTFLEALDGFASAPAEDHLPLRFPVQDVYKFDERRIIAGRIESGALKVGDEVLLSPGNTKVKIASIEAWGGKAPKQAGAGESVGITFADQVFVERGDVISHVAHAPKLTNLCRARIFWLGKTPLAAGKRYTMKWATAAFVVEIKAIEQIVDVENLAHRAGAEVEKGGIAEVVLRIRGMLAADDFNTNPRLGRFVLLEDYDVVGGGIISLDGIPDLRVQSQGVKSKNIFDVDLQITQEQRAIANGHAGGILWFTGLSGAGKSTLALALQQRLFAKGYQVFVLDGDNIRRGLNNDLGFAPEDRAENIRRVGEVAALFAQAGFIVITAFISPYREDRQRAYAAAPEAFHSVYIKADLAACEKRDAKGLYKKARTGEIKDFTGISAPYEEPENPDLIVDTERGDVAQCVDQLAEYVEREFVR